MDLIKLHLGCGPHIFPGWKNYDLEPGPGGIRCNLTHWIPEKSETVDFIFTEHFIEHLTFEEGIHLLSECYRVLKPGGALRISTPDLFYLVSCYGCRELSKWAPTWQPKSRAKMLNEGMRSWGHQFLYDGEELINALRISGFTDWSAPNWHESPHEALRNLEVRPYIGDLIMEAVK